MAAHLVYFALPALLMMLGLPIFAVLVLTSLAAIVFVADVPTSAIPTYMFGSLDNFPLLAVPYFVLAGEIMAQGGIARRVVAWVVPGDEAPSLEELRRIVTESIAPWAAPKELVIVDDLPRTAAGKVRRRELESFNS